MQIQEKIVPNKMQFPGCKDALKFTCIQCSFGLPLSQLLFVAITYRKVSLWLWKSPENMRNSISSTLWPPCDSVNIILNLCSRGVNLLTTLTRVLVF